MKHTLSERELLFTRAQKLIISERLKHNLEDINIKQERLSLSRVSSQSNHSKTDKKITSSVDLRDVSPKVKLLHQISDKLRSSKRQLFQTPNKSPKPDIPSSSEKVEWGSQARQKAKGSKLQSMLKDIKRCNQMSTKAVSSIKKPLANDQEWTKTYFKSHSIKNDKLEPKLGGMFNQLIAIKQELRKVKEQNKLLLNLVQTNQRYSQITRKVSHGCPLCGCNCSQSKQQESFIVDPRSSKPSNGQWLK